jgi:hypothetical protein
MKCLDAAYGMVAKRYGLFAAKRLFIGFLDKPKQVKIC